MKIMDTKLIANYSTKILLFFVGKQNINLQINKKYVELRF